MSRYDRNTSYAYTDGSTRGNGQSGARGGVGVYYGDNDSRNVSRPLEGSRQTNQRAELSAVNDALRQAPYDRPERLVIRTDSEYAMKSMTTWGDRYENNGYRTSSGSSAQNQDLIQSGRSQIRDLQSQNVSVQFEHVRGHGSSYGNQMADRLANQGTNKH